MDELKIMTLYHATTYSRGIQIINDGKISCQAAPVFFWAQPTTPGWIYLSDHIDSAICWGNKVSIMNKENGLFYIFKIHLPLSDCYPDYDDLSYVVRLHESQTLEADTLTSLSLCHSCRTAKDLVLGNTVHSFCTLPVNHMKNRMHPLYPVVQRLISYVSPEEHILYEKQRRMIEWTLL